MLVYAPSKILAQSRKVRKEQKGKLSDLATLRDIMFLLSCVLSLDLRRL